MEYLTNFETGLEKRIITSEPFVTAWNWGKVREGHQEGNIGNHLQDILEYIDTQDWPEYRADLRVVALLHDIGKPLTKYSEKGHLTSEPHAFYSEQIAREFIEDDSLLRIIRNHDKYYSFFRKNRDRGKFDEEQFVDLFKGINLDLMIKFNYCDLCKRSKESLDWFQEKCVDFGLIKEKIMEKKDG
jgi:putative nucleotidyltransferase with HDIG domain